MIDMAPLTAIVRQQELFKRPWKEFEWIQTREHNIGDRAWANCGPGAICCPLRFLSRPAELAEIVSSLDALFICNSHVLPLDGTLQIHWPLSGAVSYSTLPFTLWPLRPFRKLRSIECLIRNGPLNIFSHRSPAVCLKRQETVAIFKEYNIGRPFATKHANYARKHSKVRQRRGGCCSALLPLELKVSFSVVLYKKCIWKVICSISLPCYTSLLFRGAHQ